ncbi:MAG: hypothetical protein WA624_10470, partial [Methylocella sp.]
MDGPGSAGWRTLTIIGFPTSTFPGILDELNPPGFVTLASFTCFYSLPERARLSDSNALASPRHDQKRPLLAQCDGVDGARTGISL